MVFKCKLGSLIFFVLLEGTASSKIPNFGKRGNEALMSFIKTIFLAVTKGFVTASFIHQPTAYDEANVLQHLAEPTQQTRLLG